MALDDWVRFLAPFSKVSIDSAFDAHLRDSPKDRPTPGGIQQRARGFQTESVVADNPRERLTHDEKRFLSDRVLPTAKRWLTIPGLADHGKKTLEFWEETP
ncbi:MAG: hypothetical protein GY767_06580 [Shimia sp.]|nr:hypothetical protein [Shimia sp.]